MSFTNYTPQLSWRGHDNGHTQAAHRALRQAHERSKIALPGSLVTGKPVLMGIPSRDSINDSTTLQRDRTDQIKRGGVL